MDGWVDGGWMDGWIGVDAYIDDYCVNYRWMRWLLDGWNGERLNEGWNNEECKGGYQQADGWLKGCMDRCLDGGDKIPPLGGSGSLLHLLGTIRASVQSVGIFYFLTTTF